MGVGVLVASSGHNPVHVLTGHLASRLLERELLGVTGVHERYDGLHGSRIRSPSYQGGGMLEISSGTRRFCGLGLVAEPLRQLNHERSHLLLVGEL